MNKHMKYLHKQLDIIAEIETEEGVIVKDKVGWVAYNLYKLALAGPVCMLLSLFLLLVMSAHL